MRHFIDLSYNLQQVLLEVFGENAKNCVFETEGDTYRMFEYVREFKAVDLYFEDLTNDDKTEFLQSIGHEEELSEDHYEDFRFYKIYADQKQCLVKIN